MLRPLRLLPITVLLLLTACNVGPALSVGMECSSRQAADLGIQGACREELDELNLDADRTIAIQTIEILPSVTLEVSAEVDEGSLAIGFVDAKGEAVSVTAEAGSPAQARIETRLDALNQITFTLTPGPAGAKGIRYTIEFDCDCLP